MHAHNPRTLERTDAPLVTQNSVTSGQSIHSKVHCAHACLHTLLNIIHKIHCGSYINVMCAGTLFSLDYMYLQEMDGKEVEGHSLGVKMDPDA